MEASFWLVDDNVNVDNEDDDGRMIDGSDEEVDDAINCVLSRVVVRHTSVPIRPTYCTYAYAHLKINQKQISTTMGNADDIC